MASNTTTGSPKMVAIQEPHLEKSFVKVAKYWEKYAFIYSYLKLGI